MSRADWGQRGTRRWTLAVTLVAAIATAAGCGSDDGSSNGSGGGGAAEGKTIQFIAAANFDPFWKSMHCGADAEAKKSGVELKWQADETPDVAPQLAKLNSAITTHPDGIVLAPFSETAFLTPVKSQMAQGVPVVLADLGLSQKVALKQIQGAERAGGESVAQPIFDAIGSHGTIGVIAFSSDSVVEKERYGGMLDKLKQLAPDTKVLPLQYGEGSSPKAAQISQAMIRGNKDLDAIFAANGPLLIGVKSGIAATGAQDKVKAFGFGATPQALAGVRDGTVAGVVAQAPYTEGQLAVREIVDYLKSHDSKEPVKPDTANYIEQAKFTFIDRDNIDTPEGKDALKLVTCP